MNEYTIDDIFNALSPYFNGALNLGVPSGAPNKFLNGVSPATLMAGALEGNTTVEDGYFQSNNYVAATTGWRLSPTTAELNVSTALKSLDIPDTTTANSFHVNTAGDAWWGAAAIGDALAKVLKTGAITGSNVTITGGAISGSSIASIPNDTVTNISLMECSHDIVFSVTDADTIAWAAGTIVFSNGRTFTISAGNTGNMAALTYIYLDPAVSSTVLQTTTTYSTAMGANKRLIGTAQNHTVTASFIPYGAGVPLIDGANIGALSIVAANIAATTITAAKMSVSQLSAIAADLGAMTAGTVTIDTAGYVRGGQTDYNTGTGFFLGYSGAAYKFSIGDASSNYLVWDGSGLKMSGTFIVAQPIQTYTPSAAGTATLDLSLGNDHRITMPAGNITIALSNVTVGQKFLVSITQDGTGGRTATWFTTIRWADGSAPVLTVAASKRDTFGFICTGTNTYDGFILGLNI